MVNYKNKYLKYKIKYLQLKKGGGRRRGGGKRRGEGVLEFCS